MKKIHLYSPYWSTLGGGEKYVLALAKALSLLPDVRPTLLTTNPVISKEKLEQYFGISIAEVGWEYIEGGLKSVARHSADADLFIYMSNFRHIQSRSRNTALLLQIPYAEITSPSIAGKLISGQVREGFKDIARRRLITAARSDIGLTVVYSQFVHDSLLRNFGLGTSILHPPIDDFLQKNIRKKNIILSAGRFFRGLYNDKRYDILTKTFRSLSSSELKGWEYHIVGSCSDDAASVSFLNELRRDNEGFSVFFHVNEAHAGLRKLYNEATIFWHAAGFGSDEERHPERMEHFGMTTVEAMSAGCIPVVIKKGGQKEIVQHGANGFLWETVDELAGYTAKIAHDEIPAAKTRQNARRRFKHYSTQQFQKEAARIFSPLLTPKNH